MIRLEQPWNDWNKIIILSILSTKIHQTGLDYCHERPTGATASSISIFRKIY